MAALAVGQEDLDKNRQPHGWMKLRADAVSQPLTLVSTLEPGCAKRM
jgi:hypothetical protein